MSRALDQVSNVLFKVTDVLGNVVGGFLDNPLPTIATIGLTAVGVPPMFANFAGAALRGGSMEDMALNLATSYLGGQLGEAVSGAAFGDLPLEIAPEMASTATQDLIKTVITNASPAALNAAIKGESFSKVLESAVMGGVSGIIGKTIQSELGLNPGQVDDKLLGGVINSATKAILSGQDIATAISSSIAQTTIGTALGAASSGLRSTIKELQAKQSEYDTERNQVAELQNSIIEDEEWLYANRESIFNLNASFDQKREELLEDKRLVDIASRAYDYANKYNAVSPGYDKSIDDLAKELGWKQGIAYYPRVSDEGYNIGYIYVDPKTNTEIASLIDFNKSVSNNISPLIEKLNAEAPKLQELGNTISSKVEEYRAVDERYNKNINEFKTANINLETLTKDIGSLIDESNGYISNINSLVVDVVNTSVDVAEGVSENFSNYAAKLIEDSQKIISEVPTQLVDAVEQIDETILGETGFEEAPKDSLAEYVSAAVSDAVKEPPPVEGLEEGDFGFAVEPPVTPSVPIPEPQDIWPETIPQEAEDLGPPITFTPDVTETPEPPQSVEDLGPELTFTPDTTEVREVEDTGEPVIKREEVYPDFFTPPTEAVTEPEVVAPELGERVPIAAVEDEEAPALTLNAEQPVTEAPVDLSGLEELFALPPAVVEEPVEETFIPQEVAPEVEQPVDLSSLEEFFAPPQAVVEEPPVTEEGFGFEIPGDQTGTGATSFTDEDGNTFIVDEQGNTYLTGPSGEDLMPSTADFDLSKLPTTADEQALLDYTEQAGKDLAQAQDTQALIDYIEQSGMDLGQAHDAQSLIDYIEQAGADLAQSQADQSYIDYIEQAGQDLAKAHDDQAYIDYIEQAGQDLAKAHDDQAYIDYIEQAGQDLADAQQNLIDSGIVIGDLTGGGGGAGGGGGKPVTPPPVTPPPVTPTPVVQPRGQGLDFLSFLGMLGMMRPTQQPIAAAQPEQEEITPYTSWEELFTPYSDVTYPPQTTRKQR